MVAIAGSTIAGDGVAGPRRRFRRHRYPGYRADPLGHDQHLERQIDIYRQIRELAARAGCATVADTLIERGASIDVARNEILFELQVRSAANIIHTAHNRRSLDEPQLRRLTD